MEIELKGQGVVWIIHTAMDITQGDGRSWYVEEVEDLKFSMNGRGWRWWWRAVVRK